MTMGVVHVLNKLLSEKGFFFTAVEIMRASVVLLFPFPLRISFNMLSQRELSLVFDK